MGVGQKEQVYLALTTVSVLVISMAILFETRLLTFTVRDHWWRKYRVPWFALNFISACFWPLPIYLDVPEQKYAKELIMKEFPCKPDYINFELVFVFTIDNTIPTIACLVMVSIFCPQMLIYTIGTGRLLSQQMKMSISKNTIKMQMNFQKALYLQAAIPFIILLLPFLYFMSSLISNYHNQAFNNIAFIIVSSHGFLSTLSMIIVHTPYRKYTMSLLKIETRLKNNNVLAVQVIKSPTNSQFKTVI
uniref:Serpentine Receptor, class H n=1 Tax=Caenorhabditis tropicalis TaxID=1561998 RepID=A0A1I7SYC9_9PELO